MFSKAITERQVINGPVSVSVLSIKTVPLNILLNKGSLILRSIVEYILFISFPVWFVSCQSTGMPKNPAEKIIVEIHFAPGVYQKPANYTLKDKIEIEYAPISRIEYTAQWISMKARIKEGKVKWTLYTSTPVQMNYGFGKLPIVSPGDSIHIVYDGKENIFSGKGAEKLNIWNRLTAAENNLAKPTKYNFKINSMSDYFEWIKYVEDKLALQIPILETFRHKMHLSEYEYLMSGIISSAEEDRIYAFGALKKFAQKDTSSDLHLPDLIAIWDSTQYNSRSNWFRSHPNYYGSMNVFYNQNALTVKRGFSFDEKNDSLAKKDTRTFLYYNAAKKNYNGLLRERLLTYILDEPTIKEMGIENPMTQIMLKDYYSQPGFPEYKEWMKDLVKKKKENK